MITFFFLSEDLETSERCCALSEMICFRLKIETLLLILTSFLYFIFLYKSWIVGRVWGFLSSINIIKAISCGEYDPFIGFGSLSMM